MTTKTFNHKSNAFLSEMFYYETRIKGALPLPGNGAPTVTSTTIELFIAFKGIDSPVMTITADHAITGALVIKRLQEIDPQDFAALCEHYSYERIIEDGESAAEQYFTEWAPQSAINVNENGLIAEAGDLDQVN